MLIKYNISLRPSINLQMPKTLTKNELLIMGDFNFHMNKPANNKTKLMEYTLETFDLIQHVIEPRHNLGNTLDLIITRKDSKLLGYIK